MNNKILIEIPRGSRLKYQSILSNEGGDPLFKLDRVVPLDYPEAYGSIIGTTAQDGDPQDVFIISDEPLHTGKVLEKYSLRQVGKFTLKDGGVADDKEVYYMGEWDWNSNLRVRHSLECIKSFLLNYKRTREGTNPISEVELQTYNTYS